MTAAATSGHCGETQYESRTQACELATSGGWSLKATGIADLAECAAWCREHCPRCRFVSYNKATDDCSWYEACPAREEEASYAEFVFPAMRVYRVCSGWVLRSEHDTFTSFTFCFARA